MVSLSIPNISKVLTEDDDLEIAVNRALYFEPVSHALKRYSFFSLTEEDITQTVEKRIGNSLLLLTLSKPALVKGLRLLAETFLITAETYTENAETILNHIKNPAKTLPKC
ncbi:unnamed protein product [Rhizophagus irregularis]|nr:unnamed protein product [Rhizophagus irregularis]